VDKVRHHPPHHEEGKIMWNTDQTTQHLSHDLPCSGCGHAVHTYLPCSDTCSCQVTSLPGMLPIAA
jgi:hypothetical protein